MIRYLRRKTIEYDFNTGVLDHLSFFLIILNLNLIEFEVVNYYNKFRPHVFARWKYRMRNYISCIESFLLMSFFKIPFNLNWEWTFFPKSKNLDTKKILMEGIILIWRCFIYQSINFAFLCIWQFLYIISNLLNFDFVSIMIKSSLIQRSWKEI